MSRENNVMLDNMISFGNDRRPSDVLFVLQHTYKPRHEKTFLLMRKPVFGASDHIRHKLGCTATEDD